MFETSLSRLIVAGIALVTALMSAAHANAGIETYTQVDLEEPFEMFGFGLSIIALPEIQGVVIESRITVTFTPGAGFDASDFSLDVISPTENARGGFSNVWEVSGSDLGWQGSETVMASVSSIALAGQIFPEPEFAVWEVFLGPNVGVIHDLVIEHDYHPVPSPGAAVLFLLAGTRCARRRRRTHT